jgi:hypothetical protein
MRTRRRASLLRGYHQGDPLPCLSQFAVFFSHGAGFAIEVVMAFDAGHAREIARAQHPTGKLSAVPAELLEGQDRHKLLQSWLNGESRDAMQAGYCAYVRRRQLSCLLTKCEPLIFCGASSRPPVLNVCRRFSLQMYSQWRCFVWQYVVR